MNSALKKLADAPSVLQVSRVQDVLELGQSVEVKYLGKDRRNFHKISHKACLPLPPDSQFLREAEQRSSSPPKVAVLLSHPIPSAACLTGSGMMQVSGRFDCSINVANLDDLPIAFR